ncbi:MAG: hypothetical protein WBR28_18940 [Mycobacterium sp.]
MTTGVRISTADTIQTEGNYPTRQACQDAGPGGEASTPGNGNNFWCVPDRVAPGSWRLVLSKLTVPFRILDTCRSPRQS